MDRMDGKEIAELLREHFNAKLCPKTAALFGRKYLLPDYRATDYPNQGYLNDLALAQLAFRNSLVYVNPTELVSHFLALRYGRPTLFLERDLGETLLQSKLPEDLKIEDIIQQQFPSLRIILPKGLLAIYHEKFTESIMFIDICFQQENEEITCPIDVADELDANTVREFGMVRGPKLRDVSLSRPNNDAGIFVNGTSSIRYISYGITKPWKQETIADFLASFKGVMSTDVPEMDDKDLGLKVQHLGLNILILLSAVPMEYEPEEVLRKAKPEGKRLIPALLKPKWLGDHLLRARHAGMVKGQVSSTTSTGRTVAGHWVSPHWRRQPYGRGFAKRKLIWILPYQTHDKEEE